MKTRFAPLLVTWGALSLLACGSGASAPGGANPEGGTPVEDSSVAATDGDGLSPGSSGGDGGGSSGATGNGDAGSRGGEGGGSASSSGGSSGGSSGSEGGEASSLVFSAYKDITVSMDWSTNVMSSNVSGTATPLAADLVQHGGSAVTLAFATGECGSESWAGLAGDTLATANLSRLVQAGVRYVVSTGGAAGVFTCGSDAGFTTFVDRWTSAGLVGVDFDIEAGQTMSDIVALMQRIHAAHATYPHLRFSLTLATLATSTQGATAATSMGTSAPDGFNALGDSVMAAVASTFGFTGSATTWPPYVTVNPMTMDYGAAGAGVCVVVGGSCDMGQSAMQAAYNLHDKWGIPYASIELTPMLGQNDQKTEQLTLADVDTVAAFALAKGLAGVHYWSYDRDTDCATGKVSTTCNSMGAGYAGAYGYLTRFVHDGLR